MILEVDADVRRRGGFRLRASLRVEAPRVALVGPSGGGKTTLLDVIAGIERGRVVLDGDDLSRLPLHRRSIGYVMQDAPLFPHLTVRRNLAYGPRAGGIGEIAERLGIAHLLDRMPRNLSGGERRRAVLARALASRPRLLLLDEPFAGLDEARRREAMSLLTALGDVPTVLVSHSPAEVLGLAERAVRLEKGAIVAEGPSASLLRAGETGIDNLLVARVIGPSRVVAGSVEIAVRLPEGASGAVRLACYAHDVILAREAPRAISARNVFPAVVRELADAGGDVLATLEDPPLRALLTADAARDLALAPGARVFAIVKSTSIGCLGAA
ncbi:MAG TPA: ATP-binding cassette domain-containing protein [Planctomycetota bacterium]|nr:ATP-binding cassette domain-containing protein [Planctomycetota bacterium]